MQSHFSPSGRRTAGRRVVITGLYLFVILGSLAVSYPLLFMLARSVTSSVDVNENRFIPRYLFDDDILFRKYLAVKYPADKILDLNRHYGTGYENYRAIPVPRTINPVFIQTWLDFKKNLPLTYKKAGFDGRYWRNVTGPVNRQFQEYMQEKCGDDIQEYRRRYGTSVSMMREIYIPVEQPHSRTWCPVHNRLYRDFLDFKTMLPDRYLITVAVEPLWADFLQSRHYTIEKLNASWRTGYRSFSEVPLPDRLPSAENPAADWEPFIRFKCPLRYIGIDTPAVGVYREVLQEKYRTIGAFNRAYAKSFSSFEQIGYPSNLDTCCVTITDWNDFILRVSPRHFRLKTPAALFRSHLTKRFGSLDAINRHCETAFTSLQQVRPPYPEADWLEFSSRKTALRIYFITRNFGEVWNHIFSGGRAVYVTTVYILGLLLVQTLVNTLAAYSLSRFRFRFTYNMLLFFVITMVFPAEVTMIPNFLLLKKMNLLNTFWALILPGAVNGYFILVLKGYFDSIPRSLYEAAQIDGMGELTMLRKITLPLSRPIIAWLVLQSFMLGYSAFMFAMVTCQDSRMWTIMVWIYGMFNWSTPSMIAAAALIAAVPGIIIFLAAQRFIMRGMVLPLE